MAALSTAARSLMPKAVFSKVNHNAPATASPQAMAKMRCVAMVRKPRSVGPASCCGSGMVFSVGPKTKLAMPMMQNVMPMVISTCVSSGAP
ncbi:hypothetical protein D3C71_779700 [compost metagenome]